MSAIHTIPVPRGMTPEQAWEHVARGDLFGPLQPAWYWTNVEVEDGRLIQVHHPGHPTGYKPSHATRPPQQPPGGRSSDAGPPSPGPGPR